jgi:hypothetical protein
LFGHLPVGFLLPVVPSGADHCGAAADNCLDVRPDWRGCLMGRQEAQATSLQNFRSEMVTKYGEEAVAKHESEMQRCIFDKEGNRRPKYLAFYFSIGSISNRSADMESYGNLYIASNYEHAKVKA